MDKNKKLTWMDISYRQLLDIKDAVSIENDEDRLIAVMQAIYGEEVIDLPLLDFKQLTANIGFLSTPVPSDLNVKNCKVNDREYEFQGILGNLSTVQYIDFNNFVKKNDELKSFAVFFIPKGHKYNDGYDMQQVFDDILDMPAPVLISASFFFSRQLEVFSTIFQYYSKKKMKKLKIPKQTKDFLMKIQARLANLASHHSS